MKTVLTNKTIVLGVTGSIAAYKAADIASRLTKAGAKVDVVMTEAATRFISPLALRGITGRAVATDMFDLESQYTIEHVSLAEAADVVVVAPATASLIAKAAAGISDDMLTLTLLATKAPIILAPAMNVNMFENSVTQENLAKLRARGFIIVDPAHGRLASGRVGKGRLADIDQIMGAIQQVLGRSGDLAGKKVVVTAGGTREPIDPVRHIGNPSSGKMGYAIAEAAWDRGAKVTLITAPASLLPPSGMAVVPVKTALEMKQAVTKAVKGADALIMAAAVADYQPRSAARAKIKKDAPGLTLELVRTPDILAEVKGKFLKVGFAAESEDIVANAKKKLKNKQLDIIVANDITDKKSGFGVDTNKVTLIDKKGKVETLPLLSKREVADKILDKVVGLLAKQSLQRTEIIVQLGRRTGEGSPYHIDIPNDKIDFFPNYKVSFTIKTDIGEFETYLVPKHTKYSQDHFHLPKWFKAHPQLKMGDKLTITVIEPLEKYRLEILR